MTARMSVLLLLIAAVPGLAFAKDPVPPPGDWKNVAQSAGQTAFLDMGSLEQTERGLKAAVKINYATPQAFGKKTYQSVRNVYVMDCTARRLADRENSIYPGLDLAGKRISHASRNAKNFIWRDAPVASIDGELLTYACKQPIPAPAPKK